MRWRDTRWSFPTRRDGGCLLRRRQEWSWRGVGGFPLRGNDGGCPQRNLPGRRLGQPFINHRFAPRWDCMFLVCSLLDDRTKLEQTVNKFETGESDDRFDTGRRIAGIDEHLSDHRIAVDRRALTSDQDQSPTATPSRLGSAPPTRPAGVQAMPCRPEFKSLAETLKPSASSSSARSSAFVPFSIS
jgi:hypothetical protein